MTTPPNLHFNGFSLWIDGRQFPDVLDFWDRNWLMVRARMEANGAHVECAGPILMTTDIRKFRDQLDVMATSLAGEATLKGLEPEINVVLRMQKLGHVEAVIEITANHINQYHRFIVEGDQSYLPGLIRSCDAILCKFPVIGKESI
ncbi:WapI family immunity protein [Brucella rhizosphaerae]|uniref:WapI family immunity protein n=1 Tax=Brucella rhizosphaerae TaxID=571254 RepID=UPI003D76782E